VTVASAGVGATTTSTVTTIKIARRRTPNLVLLDAYSMLISDRRARASSIPRHVHVYLLWNLTSVHGLEECCEIRLLLELP
jgi:hypothetical protein